MITCEDQLQLELGSTGAEHMPVHGALEDRNPPGAAVAHVDLSAYIDLPADTDARRVEMRQHRRIPFQLSQGTCDRLCFSPGGRTQIVKQHSGSLAWLHCHGPICKSRAQGTVSRPKSLALGDQASAHVKEAAVLAHVQFASALGAVPVSTRRPEESQFPTTVVADVRWHLRLLSGTGVSRLSGCGRAEAVGLVFSIVPD